MTKENNLKQDPLKGTQVVSTLATGGAGGIFQARVGALYLANMLTGIQSAFGLHGGRVETLRFEARYTGAHTDDIYCQIRDKENSRLQLVQCKRGLNATAGDQDFIDGLQAAWRDFRQVGNSPFNRACDVLVLATVAPAKPANQAAKRLCELSRASLNLQDFVQKVESKLFDVQHKRTWSAFKQISQETLADQYTDQLVFDLLKRLRIDIHDLGNETSQELSLIHALLSSGQPAEFGELAWNGLFSYVLEQGIAVGTITRETWKTTAQSGIQDTITQISSGRGFDSVAERLSNRASHQLSLISTKLPNGTHISRGECAAKVLAGFDERQLVIITGGPGVGKSAVIAELAPLVRESGSLFFFRADELDQPSLAAVQSLSNTPDAVLSLERLMHNGTPIVVIDSLEKILEASNPSALKELLALVRLNKRARLCITTRSYALNALYSLFLSEFALKIVEVPLLTDIEIAAAVTNTALEDVVAKDTHVREVLRAPYYLRLAFNYIASGLALPQAISNDLRLHLWKERVAPSAGLPLGLAERRRIAFDHVCYARTERFTQFVEAPDDAEAITSLVQDLVLTKDSAERVAPAHDVLEDWALFFRVEREVRNVERDWAALFLKLGSHAGMRRAVRAWTVQRSAEGDLDAYALLEAALKQDSIIPQLWRDEVAIGLLRSERVVELFENLCSSISVDNNKLLQRLSHLLRVACKGPSSIDYSHLVNDPANKELLARIGMTAPVGEAWDVVIGLVAKAFPSMPPSCHSWVVQLAEDATSQDEKWHQPAQRVHDVFKIAEYYCLHDQESWYRENSVGKRFYGLLCRCAGANPVRFDSFINVLLQRLFADHENRDFYAEERLQFMVNVKNCREASYFMPDLVWKVFWSLYTQTEPKVDRDYDDIDQTAEFGLSMRAAHEFFPPSVLQGPFRSLLLYAWPKSIRFVVDLCNHAANSLASTNANQVCILSSDQSPNCQPHIHSYSLWVSYRGHSVTNYVLNAALMALEEHLLFQAEAQSKYISQVLELIVEQGQSSFTTGVVASVLTAHPQLINEKLLCIFKCREFFSTDIARRMEESGALAIHGGHDGLDAARQRERAESNRLAHRSQYLEGLLLQLQFNRPDLRAAIFKILDNHLEALKTATDVPDGWRITLKRMDVRGLKIGEPVVGGKWAALEIANLEPELQEASDDAQARMQWMNRVSEVRLWAAAVTGRFSSAQPGTTDRFSSPSEPYEEFVNLKKDAESEETVMLAGLENELACALIQKWPTSTSQALEWARTFIIEHAAIRGDNDKWMRQASAIGELQARIVILLATINPSQPKLIEALVNTVTEPVWKLRRAAAVAISADLRHAQPVLAEILTTGLAQYADALSVEIDGSNRRPGDFVKETRKTIANALSKALKEMKPGVRSSPKNLRAIKEWVIAIDAARSEASDAWRHSSLITLGALLSDQEKGSRFQRHDPEYVDHEARWELGDIIAAELMALANEESPLFNMFDYCLEKSPELCERILQAVLRECMKLEFANTTAFWRIWDRASTKVFKYDSLRTKSRDSYSTFDKVLSTLLLCSMPWPGTLYDLALFKSRPHFIANCLTAVGDSRTGLENILRLMSGVGRVSAVPSALPQLRDAVGKAPTDLFDDGNSLWNAETICRVAVHEYRETLIRDVNLRKATLDILDRLVEAGSSIAFQLRDYLATSPTTSMGARV